MFKVNSLILSLGILVAQSGFAYEKILCVGGYKTPRLTYTVELTPELDLPGGLHEGSIAFGDHGNLQYTVQKLGDGYMYRAQMQNSSDLFINEKVEQFPAMRSKTISPDEEVFIECKPYSPIDYCRIHTC